MTWDILTSQGFHCSFSFALSSQTNLLRTPSGPAARLHSPSPVFSEPSVDKPSSWAADQSTKPEEGLPGGGGAVYYTCISDKACLFFRGCHLDGGGRVGRSENFGQLGKLQSKWVCLYGRESHLWAYSNYGWIRELVWIHLTSSDILHRTVIVLSFCLLLLNIIKLDIYDILKTFDHFFYMLLTAVWYYWRYSRSNDYPKRKPVEWE